MSRPPSSRAWFALIAGIVAGYVILGSLLWLQDDRMMVAAMGVSLLGLLMSLRGWRRWPCTAPPVGGG
jgi:hypothetical protein